MGWREDVVCGLGRRRLDAKDMFAPESACFAKSLSASKKKSEEPAS